MIFYKIIAISGKFDPIYPYDIEFMKFARSLGDELVVIAHNDRRIQVGWGNRGMQTEKRLDRLDAFDFVDAAILTQHGTMFRDQDNPEYHSGDLSVGYELEQLRPWKYVTHAKRDFQENEEVCKRLDIPIEFYNYEEYHGQV